MGTIKTTLKYVLIFFLMMSCIVEDDEILEDKSNAKKIISFVFKAEDNDALAEDVTATINENNKTVKAQMAYGTDISALVPEIEVSVGATASPTGAQDFSSLVHYTVNAQDESTTTYSVQVEIEPNSEKEILSFRFLKANNPIDADIYADINEDEKAISASMPLNLDLSSLTPTIEISPGATLSPEGPQDFNDTVTYQVTAQDGSTASYEVVASILESKVLIALYNANPNNTLDWNLNDPDLENWSGVTLNSQGKILELNLLSKNLDILVPEVSKLKALERLALTDNNLSSIPPEIRDLSELNFLFLKGNELSTLPEAVVNLKNLKTISLANNNLTEFPQQNYLLFKLQELDLSENEIAYISPNLQFLTELRALDLHGNKLTYIDQSIFKLKNLEELSLTGNEISNLPSEISQLINLKWLFLSGNTLNTLPTQINKLMSLEKLLINSNNISSLPEELWSLPNLRELDLRNNSLTAVPKFVGGLKSLAYIYTEGNYITYVAPEIGNVGTLRILRLGNNELTEIPKEIGQLTNLEILWLDDNKLSFIPIPVCTLGQNIDDYKVDPGVPCQ